MKNKVHPHALNLIPANRQSKRLSGVATTARRLDNGGVAIKYHNTDVVTYGPDGSITVNTGGYRTATTKARINEYLPNGYPRLYQSSGVWYWGGVHYDKTPFNDGDTFGPRGALKSANSKEKKEEAARVKTLTKAINKYADLCASSLPLPMPSGGDCWYCYMHVSEGEHKGESLGDATGNTSHFLSHFEEGYVVPSLVWNALVANGYSPQRNGIVFASIFKQEGNDFVDSRYANSIGPDIVRRAVRRYLKAQFKIAGGAYRNSNDKAKAGFAVR